MQTGIIMAGGGKAIQDVISEYQFVSEEGCNAAV